MSLDADAKKVLLRKIPHGLFICGVAEGDVVNGFTASWVTQGSFEPPLVVMAVRADSTSNGMIQRTGKFSLNVLAADQKGRQVVIAVADPLQRERLKRLQLERTCPVRFLRGRREALDLLAAAAVSG